jgi:outer membrane protein assembly factor BamE
MQMQRPYSNRAPTIAGAFCLMLATALSGCASKNPLMEEPTPVASAAKPAPAPQAPVSAAEKPNAAAEPAAAKTPQAAPAATASPADGVASSVHTKREKRFLGIFSPYKPDVQQGNFVSQEMVAQLKEGMTPNQVVFLLGTPLLTDIFHADRWDYAFRMQKGNGVITTSRVTVFFKDGVVSHFEGGGDLPTEADYLARIADKAKAAKK